MTKAIQLCQIWSTRWFVSYVFLCSLELYFPCFTLLYELIERSAPIHSRVVLIFSSFLCFYAVSMSRLAPPSWRYKFLIWPELGIKISGLLIVRLMVIRFMKDHATIAARENPAQYKRRFHDLQSIYTYKEGNDFTNAPRFLPYSSFPIRTGFSLPISMQNAHDGLTACRFEYCYRQKYY